ncbi:MAG: septum formation initiator family protein [Ilumatobacteraceae bacterium]|jgi:cell division protein FtsB|nr:septum formation initiator family protein [Ilumatobacteraceae bacterium]
MARGNKTSSIPRATRKKSSKRSRLSKAVADRTRPTPRTERLLPKLLGRTLMLVGAVVIVISFGNSFLVLPATSWLGQRQEVDARTEELETIKQATDELQTEVDRLNTPAGVEDAAREELGYVMAGEQRQQIVGDSQAPIELPTGWPYDLVTQIVAVRVNEAAAEAAAENAPTENPPTEDPTSVTVVTVPLP